ncbi:MAG TPA: hypothetical protein VG943_07905 [Caulobacterales bacterium]|nr:hypothetical protein [Caulobacterales bacterium]
MNRLHRDALIRLEGAMPSTDPPVVWEEALRRMQARLPWLRCAVFVCGGVPLISVFFLLFLATIQLLPHNWHIGIRIGIGGGCGGAGCAMTRDFFASIPGFGWAKELKRISDAVEPFQRHRDWLAAKDRAL